MTKDLTTVEPSLRRVLEMDVDRTSAVGTIPIIQELVPVFKQAGTLAEVGLAALVYSLATTKVLDESAEVKAKWEMTSLVKDREGEWLPFARTWSDFCYVHLGIDPAMASGYKRLWEVFAVNLGMDLADLQAAGVHRLRLAAPTMARLYPEVDLPLFTAIFGSPDRCGYCGAEPGRDVGTCPSCGKPFEPASGSIAEVALRLKQLKETPEDIEGFKVLADLRPVLDGDRVVGWVISPQAWQEDEQEFVSYVPPWDIPIIEDDAAPDSVGIRRSHAEGFHHWLGRHFG